MVDFRYHALSLVAVFLALGIGIVLGVTVGDSLVSNADRNLRDSLRDDVTDAREQVREEQDLATRREEVIEESAPLVASNRLRGRRVAVVALGDLPGGVDDALDDAVGMAGGDITRTFVLSPPEFPRARTTRRQERLGRRFGRAVERGGARRLRADEPRRVSGDLAGPVDAVVVYRDPPDDPGDDAAERELDLREAFEEGLFERLRENVVGVETTETDPSQVSWYDDRVIASVDNVNLPSGRLALVLLLQQAAIAEITGEGPEGHFGYKESADQALPDLSD